MSKVFSFRLDADNPREAQAREVIEAWVGEGYSLRYVIVEALISFKKEGVRQGEVNSLVEKLQDLILSFEKPEAPELSETPLSNSFLVAMKQSAKDGVKL